MILTEWLESSCSLADYNCSFLRKKKKKRKQTMPTTEPENTAPSEISNPPLIDTQAPSDTGKGTAPAPQGELPKTALGNQVPVVTDFIKSFASISSMTEKMRTYIESLEKVIDSEKKKIRTNPTISIEHIANPRYEGVAVHDEVNAYILLFADSGTSLDDTPMALHSQEARRNFQAIHPGIKTRQCICLCEHDLDRSMQMGIFLVNEFAMLYSDKTLKARSFKDVRLNVITNPDIVNAYVNKYSPHGVRARADIGALVCIETQVDGIDGQKTTQNEPILAITGYTRFIRTENQNLIQQAKDGSAFNVPYGSPQIVAFPCVSEIVSFIPDPGMLSFAFTLAGDAFCGKGLWLTPYKKFAKDAPNIGNLVYFNGKPAPCQNIAEVEQCAQHYIGKPLLGIDISEGRARPSGIDLMYGDPSSVQQVINKIRDFFGEQPPTDNNHNRTVAMYEMNPVIMKFSNFTGYYQDKGRILDTRNVDYLNLASHVQDPKTIAQLLVQSFQPADSFANIKTLYPGETTKAVYMTTTVIINSNLVAWMANGLKANGVQCRYDLPESGNYDFSPLLQSGEFANYASLGFAATSSPFNSGMMTQNATGYGI